MTPGGGVAGTLKRLSASSVASNAFFMLLGGLLVIAVAALTGYPLDRAAALADKRPPRQHVAGVPFSGCPSGCFPNTTEFVAAFRNKTCGGRAAAAPTATQVLIRRMPELEPFRPMGVMPDLLHRYYDAIVNHVADGVLLFTVIQLRGEGGKEDFWRYAANWDKNVRRAYPPAFHDRRLIVGTDQTTCDVLNRKGIPGCVVDFSAHWKGSEDPKSSVTLKYQWAHMALSFGFRVLFNDADITYTGEGNPLDYLIGERLLYGDGKTLPDLQVLSDHHNDDCGVTKDNLRVFKTLSRTTADWMTNTYDVWHAKRPRVPDCIVQSWYGDDATCLSTGFWLAIPTAPTLQLFAHLTTTIAVNRAWEQSQFNQLLPFYFRQKELKVVVLDPRVIGNIKTQRCMAEAFPALLKTLLPTVRDPSRVDPKLLAAYRPNDTYSLRKLVVHYGYVHDSGKELFAREIGHWLVD